jgi:O-antigen/teichoic acid export membrane protein
MVATGVALVVNVALNLALIPKYGFMGAAVAGFASEIAVAGVNAWYVQRYVARTHIIRSVIRPTLAAVAAGVAIHFMPWLRLYQALPLAAILYVAALLALRSFSAAEMERFWALVRIGAARIGWRTAEPTGDPGSR